MIQVSLDEAYREACQALGESLVEEHLLTVALAQWDASPPDEQERHVVD